MVLIDTHFFVCNKKLSDLTPIKKKFEREDEVYGRRTILRIGRFFITNK